MPEGTRMARSAASSRDATSQDFTIEAYRAKRDFAGTSEPTPGMGGQGQGAQSTMRAPVFVVQKHKARRAGLHWDFRLE